MMQIHFPKFSSSDEELNITYNYRREVYQRHVKETPDGHVITEFLPNVGWAGKYNTISCAASHHFRDGRWMHETYILEDYAKYWCTASNARVYSFPISDSFMALADVTGDYTLPETMYEKLQENHDAWDDHKTASGMYRQGCGYDGMEYSISGDGVRPTLNSYMTADKYALARIADRLGKHEDAQAYRASADALARQINEVLWNEEIGMFGVISDDGKRQNVREQIGYVPWIYGIPTAGKDDCFANLFDESCFLGKYGLRTADASHPEYNKPFDHECLWNGPVWPFATAQTLTAMGNFLNNYKQTILKKKDYYNLLHTYANSQFDVTEAGERIPYVDENIDPFTGEWIARKILRNSKNPSGGADRGADYNHSTFCDLVITGLVGLRPREDNIIEINPMFEEEDLDYLCADGILYHGRSICVCWDKTGMRYGKGKGLRIYIDGKEVAAHNSIRRISLNI